MLGVTVLDPLPIFRHPYAGQTILGRPQAHYALRALMASGIVSAHYVLCADPKLCTMAESLGCRILPRPAQPIEKSPDPRAALNLHVGACIAADLGLEPAPGQNPYAALTREHRFLFFDANLPLLRPGSLRAMEALSRKGRFMVFLGVEEPFTTMLGMEEDALFPLLYDTAQDFYEEQYRPPLVRVYENVRIANLPARVPGRQEYYCHRVDSLEGTCVLRPEEALMAEAFLTARPEWAEERAGLS